MVITDKGGAPPLDWHTDQLDGDWLWKLTTAPYRGAHFATFPLTLPRRLIAAMCPQQVCRECGWPTERISTAEYTPHGAVNRMEPRLVNADSRTNPSAQGMQHGRATKNVTTVGFTDCGHDNWRTGVAFDPFGGSGTTAVAAALEGRDAVLIDLDERNVDLTRRRLTEACHITSEHRDGNTWVWTVEAPLPGQARVHADQTSIFDFDT